MPRCCAGSVAASVAAQAAARRAAAARKEAQEQLEMARPPEVSVGYGGSGHVHHSPSLAMRRRCGDGAAFTPIGEGKDGASSDRSTMPTGPCAPFILAGRCINKLFDVLNSIAVQTIFYLAFVALFQLLTESLRLKEECAHASARVPSQPPGHTAHAPCTCTVHNPYSMRRPPTRACLCGVASRLPVHFDKMIADTFLDNHFDASHNNFQTIRRTADFYEWGNNVLLPGLFANAGPCTGAVGAYGSFESATDRPSETDFVDAMRRKGCNDDAWPDGDGSFHMDAPTAYSVAEIAEIFDMFDWSEGLIFKQCVCTAPPSTARVYVC